ncbi:MAG TPA: zinc-binding alcohol dehydrogenase family protein, partial [Streptosporangiaceae bacterium]
EAAMRVLSPRGRLVNLGSSAGAQASLGSATLRGGMLSVLGYTNNMLTGEQKAAALGEILTHAAAGRLTVDRETLPLGHATEGWSRCGQAPHRRAVLIP